MKLFSWWNRDRTAFRDAAYPRAAQPALDERCDTLPVAAHNHPLTNVHPSKRRNHPPTDQPSVPAARFAAAGVLDELTSTGFISVRESRGYEKGPQATLADD